MNIRTFFFIVLLVVFAVGAGSLRLVIVPRYFPDLLVQTTPSPLPDAVAAPLASPDPLLTNEPLFATTSATLLQKLTPRQKVMQLIALPVSVASEAGETRFASLSEVPGVVTLFGKNVTALDAERVVAATQLLGQRAAITESLSQISTQEYRLLRPLIAIDHEGGEVQRLRGEGMTILPSAQELCQTSDGELDSLLQRSAREVASVGVEVVFAPVIDQAVDHPILTSRVCSDDPEAVSRFAQKWITIFEQEGVTSVLKHYPGIGGTTKDTHTTPDSIVLNPLEQRVFASLLRANPTTGVMTSHVVIDSGGDIALADTAGLPCTIVQGCLGLIPSSPLQLRFTDALEMAGARGLPTAEVKISGQLPDLAVQAIGAGHTVVVFGEGVSSERIKEVIVAMSNEYQRSVSFRKQVDEAVLKIWRKKHNAREI